MLSPEVAHAGEVAWVEVRAPCAAWWSEPHHLRSRKLRILGGSWSGARHSVQTSPHRHKPGQVAGSEIAKFDALKVFVKPFVPFDGVKVAFIEHDGFLIEILQGDQAGLTSPWWGLRVPSSTKNRQKITKIYQELPRIDHFLPAMVGIASTKFHHTVGSTKQQVSPRIAKNRQESTIFYQPWWGSLHHAAQGARASPHP